MASASSASRSTPASSLPGPGRRWAIGTTWTGSSTRGWPELTSFRYRLVGLRGELPSAPAVVANTIRTGLRSPTGLSAAYADGPSS